MIRIRLLILLVVFPLLTAGCATKTVYINKQPPQRKLEIKTAKPTVNHIWVEGHWKWSKLKTEYVWKQGYWKNKKQNKVWVSGHWKKTPRGWLWIHGYWN